jgi:hypothetical protein
MIGCPKGVEGRSEAVIAYFVDCVGVRTELIGLKRGSFQSP